MATVRSDNYNRRESKRVFSCQRQPNHLASNSRPPSSSPESSSSLLNSLVVDTMSQVKIPHQAAASAITCSSRKSLPAQPHNQKHLLHYKNQRKKQEVIIFPAETSLYVGNRRRKLNRQRFHGPAVTATSPSYLSPVSVASQALNCFQVNQNQIFRRQPPMTFIASILIALISLNHFIITPTLSQQEAPSRYRLNNPLPAPYGRYSQQQQQQQQSQATSAAAAGNPAIVPQVWARGLVPEYQDESLRDNNNNAQNDQSLPLIVRRNSNSNSNNNNRVSNGNNMMKSVRHIVTGNTAATSSSSHLKSNTTTNDDICLDRLCYGLPMGCLGNGGSSSAMSSMQQPSNLAEQGGGGGGGSLCSVLVTSKRFIDPNRPVSRDILFELIALPVPDISNYAAVGFSETGRMQGLVSECLQYRDAKTQLQIIKLKHSYNTPGMYSNIPVTILSGIKNLGVSYENGYYQCRWIVESAVEFSYEATNGSIINRREDLGYKNYHILLASGEYNEINDVKNIHMDRISSMMPVSLAQTGHIKSLGSHILIRIHGSLMVAIWVGLVTLSIVLARYYKNEWSNSKISDLAIWFVVHRTLMLTSWFGSFIAVIFAYMYTETYHPGLHQISGTTCLVLTTIQIIGGLFRPSQESSKRIYFNWMHFICGNLSYLFAMICLITAAFLAPAHLPPLYIWIMVIFVGAYALTHTMMTIHQYIVHKSSKISITPMSDLNSNSSSTYTSCGFVADSYPKEVNSPFRQFMLGILVTIIVIFIVLLISIINIK